MYLQYDCLEFVPEACPHLAETLRWLVGTLVSLRLKCYALAFFLDIEHFRILKISRGNIDRTFFSAGRRETFRGFYLDGGVPETRAVPKVILWNAYILSSRVGSSQ